MTPPVRVLQSFKRPRATTNPYIVMLRRTLQQQDGVEVIDFDWRTALTGRWDVLHLHWPETLVSGRTAVTKAIRQLFFLLILLRAKLTRAAVVRTQHNVELPTGISRREVALLKLADRMTTLRIVLNDHTPLPDGQAGELIPHGHYRDWYAAYPATERVPGRIAFVGLVRRYKGIDTLVTAFHELRTEPAELRVAGRPSSEDLRASLERAAEQDPRISLRLEFLPDEDLVREMSSAELVVLPYPKMHNSGAALAALSLGRPILVPDNPINRDLAAEVGPGWVHLFAGSITATDLARALADLRREQPNGPPDLRARDWDRTGSRHLDAYRRALEITRRRPAGMR